MKEHCNYKENNGTTNCYYHPSEILVGVCPHCLNDRLIILAAKQGLKNKSKFLPSVYYNNKSKPSISRLPKIFALGSFLNRRRNLRHRQNSHHFNFLHDLDSTSTSLEDESSFISIKFGENGVAVASWDKSNSTTSTVSKVSMDNSTMSWSGQTLVKPKGNCNNNENDSSNKCVVEHTTPRVPLRWPNRIGQLLHVIKWRRSSKATSTSSSGGNNYSNKSEGVKVVRNNKGWIRSLNNRTKE